MSKLEIVLDRHDRIYHQGDAVSGHVCLTATNAWTHQGISMTLTGAAKFQSGGGGSKGSSGGGGIFDPTYKSIKPLELVHLHIPVIESGKVAVGVTNLPFAFRLIGNDQNDQQELFETYHGVYINITYDLSVRCVRGLMKKTLQHTVEVVVEIPRKQPLADLPQKFRITPEELENVPPQYSIARMPEFRISGHLHRSNCPVNLPLTGEIVIEEAPINLRSIALQLVRVETIMSKEGVAREATEIQNLQLAMGDVCRNLAIPIFMIFPPLFTCPTLCTREFKVDFEINLVILFENGHMITENFPIILYRC